MVTRVFTKEKARGDDTPDYTVPEGKSFLGNLRIERNSGVDSDIYVFRKNPTNINIAPRDYILDSVVDSDFKDTLLSSFTWEKTGVRYFNHDSEITNPPTSQRGLLAHNGIAFFYDSGRKLVNPGVSYVTASQLLENSGLPTDTRYDFFIPITYNSGRHVYAAISFAVYCYSQQRIYYVGVNSGSVRNNTSVNTNSYLNVPSGQAITSANDRKTSHVSAVNGNIFSLNNLSLFWKGRHYYNFSWSDHSLNKFTSITLPSWYSGSSFFYIFNPSANSNITYAMYHSSTSQINVYRLNTKTDSAFRIVYSINSGASYSRMNYISGTDLFSVTHQTTGSGYYHHKNIDLGSPTKAGSEGRYTSFAYSNAFGGAARSLCSSISISSASYHAGKNYRFLCVENDGDITVYGGPTNNTPYKKLSDAFPRYESLDDGLLSALIPNGYILTPYGKAYASTSNTMDFPDILHGVRTTALRTNKYYTCQVPDD